MIIKPEEINKILNLADTYQINRGKKYYEQDRVSILEIESDKNENFKIKTVVSDIDTYNYFVSVNKLLNNIHLSCDCKEYKNNGALCSHIIATLFDIYIDFEKYENFKEKENNLAEYNIEDEKELKKYLPIELNRKDILSSIYKTLKRKDDNRFILIYKLTLDLFTRGNYNNLMSIFSEFINEKNQRIKVFEWNVKNPVLRLVVNKNDNLIKLKLDLNDFNFFIYKRNLFYRKDDYIYKCDNDFSIRIIPFLIYYNYFKKEEITVMNEEELLKYVLSQLIKYKFIKIISDINFSKKCEPYSLSTNLYFDVLENQNIELKIEYCYNDKKYDYFDSKKDLSLRNEYEELLIKKEFLDYGFKFSKNTIYLENEEKIYSFLKNNINSLMVKYTLFFSEQIKKKKVKNLESINFNVSLFEDLIELDVSNYDIRISELKKILESYKLKKKFFKLKDGTYIDLEDKKNYEFMDNLKDILSYGKSYQNDKFVIEKKNAIYLDYIFNNDKNITIKYDDSFKEYIKSILKFEIKEYELPKYLNANLRNYQLQGYNYLKTLNEFNFNGILADEMGLGKTLQTITLLESEKEKNKTVSIVVCPSSLYLNWQKEIERFAPNLRCLTIYGNVKKREKLISKINKYDVIVTSYDILKRDIDKYLDIDFNYIIADEAQYIKNNFTKNAKALKLLKSKNRLALTGTPVENSLSEVWSIFDFIMPGYLFSYKKFKEKFEKPIVQKNDNNASTLLKKMISPFILRRLKKDVLNDLPKKSETVIYNIMNEEQQKVYDTYLLKANKEIREELVKSGLNKSHMKILSIITRLRQICLHPKLFIENYEGESSKLEQCIELICNMIESDHKIVLFSGFTSMFNILEDKLKEKNIKFYKLQGDTKSETRLDLVNKFNKNDDVKLFLVSLKAGGVGLNLTGADVVMHFDPWWNFSREIQATDRTHRIGQMKNVQVFKYITANSIEEKIQKMQIKKKNLADLVLSSENNFLNKLTEEEILELFKKD